MSGPMIDPAAVLVVIPAWNEAAAVAGVVAEVRATLPTAGVLVVDDGSSDATAARAAAAGAEIVVSPFNLGVGGAMRIGFRYAWRRGYAVVVQIDADGQHDPSDLPALLAPLDPGGPPQMVIGTRFAAGARRDISGPRRLAMRLLACYLSQVTGTRLDDVTSGFRAHNRAVIELFARSYPAEYLSDTVESLVIAHQGGARFSQVAVAMRPRAGGAPSQSLPRAIAYLARVMLILALNVIRGPGARAEPLLPSPSPPVGGLSPASTTPGGKP